MTVSTVPVAIDEDPRIADEQDGLILTRRHSPGAEPVTAFLDWSRLDDYRRRYSRFGFVQIAGVEPGTPGIGLDPDAFELIVAGFHECSCGNVAEWGRDCRTCSYQGDDDIEGD